MSNKLKILCLVSTGLLMSFPALAVDLVGVHDLALKSDPRLRAAEFRREATGENRKIARANLPGTGAPIKQKPPSLNFPIQIPKIETMGWTYARVFITRPIMKGSTLPVARFHRLMRSIKSFTRIFSCVFRKAISWC